MRNKILSITRNSIPYIKELRPKCGSVTSCLLMQQLDYWFERNPEGFFKFKVSCNNPLYKKGDSWVEELGFSDDEFTMAFSKIGVVYTSKTAFQNAIDKFESKFYLSYFDRQKGLTFYHRNHDLVDDFLDNLVVSVNQDSRFTVKQENKFTENKKVVLQENKKVDVSYIAENTTTDTTTDTLSSAKFSDENSACSKKEDSSQNEKKESKEKEEVSVKKTPSKAKKDSDPMTKLFLDAFHKFYLSKFNEKMIWDGKQLTGIKTLQKHFINRANDKAKDNHLKNGQSEDSFKNPSDEKILEHFEKFLGQLHSKCKTGFDLENFSPCYIGGNFLKMIEKANGVITAKKTDITPLPTNYDRERAMIQETGGKLRFKFGKTS